jgi:hypothetical protein
MSGTWNRIYLLLGPRGYALWYQCWDWTTLGYVTGAVRGVMQPENWQVNASFRCHPLNTNKLRVRCVSFCVTLLFVVAYVSKQLIGQNKFKELSMRTFNETHPHLAPRLSMCPDIPVLPPLTRYVVVVNFTLIKGTKLTRNNDVWRG